MIRIDRFEKMYNPTVVQIGQSLKQSQAVSFMSKAFADGPSNLQDAFLKSVYDQLTQPGQRVSVIGVNISHDSFRLDLCDFNKVEDFAKLAEQLKGNKLGKVYVNYHEPMVKVPSSFTEFMRVLDTQGKLHTPITLPKLVEFSLFHQSAKLTDRLDKVSVKDVLKDCSAMYNYVVVSPYLNYIASKPKRKDIQKCIAKSI